jgi:hypothetical protein
VSSEEDMLTTPMNQVLQQRHGQRTFSTYAGGTAVQKDRVSQINEEDRENKGSLVNAALT